MDMGFILL